MAITYKGDSNRERWLEPADKFKAKKAPLVVPMERLVEPVLKQEADSNSVVVDSKVNEVKLTESVPPEPRKPKRKGRSKKKTTTQEPTGKKVDKQDIGEEHEMLASPKLDGIEEPYF